MNIELLLKKFYEGVSSPEEELFLMEYFLKDENVDERLKEDQQLFRFLHNTQIQVPAGVSERLEKSIMQMETPLETRLETPLKTSQKSFLSKRTRYYWMSSAAAAVLLCIGLFFNSPKPETTRMADTYSNPEEAALVAEQTLAYMSTQLNKGLNKVADVKEEFIKVNKILNNQLNK